MSNRLLVGNLSLEATESQLELVFSRAGLVKSVVLVTDACTGKKKGFAFIEMSRSDEADKAVELLHGIEIDKRCIIVNVTQPVQQKLNLSFIAKCMRLLHS